MFDERRHGRGAAGAAPPGGPGHRSGPRANDAALPLLKIEGEQPDLLQVGRPDHTYWIADGVWGAKGMTRGRFTTTNGTAYETAYGAPKTAGPRGEVGW